MLAWTKEIVGRMVWKRARFQMYLEIRAIIIYLRWLWEKERKIKENFRFGATERIGLPFTEMRKPSEKVDFTRNKLTDTINSLFYLLTQFLHFLTDSLREWIFKEKHSKPSSTNYSFCVNLQSGQHVLSCKQWQNLKHTQSTGSRRRQTKLVDTP